MTTFLLLMPEPKEAPVSATERQRRYRDSRHLVSIDVGRQTVDTLGTLRARTGMTTDALIATSLAVFAAELDSKSQPKRRKALPVEQSKRINRIRTTNSPPSTAGRREAPAQSPSPGDKTAERAPQGGQAASSSRKGRSKKPHRGTKAERSSAAQPVQSRARDVPPPQGTLDVFDDRKV